MDWRQECLCSAEQADEFLRRELRAWGVTDALFHAKRDKGLLVWSECQDGDATLPVLALEVVSQAHQCTLTNMTVGYAFRHRGNSRNIGPGRLGLKAALAVAFEGGHSEITLFSVRQDGPSFWASLGAVPCDPPILLASHIDYALREKGSEIEVTSRRTFEAIRLVAETHPEKAWRELSQDRTKLADGSFFKSAVFLALCEGRNMKLPLTEDFTRTVLRKHLGALPAFPTQTPERVTRPRLIHEKHIAR